MSRDGRIALVILAAGIAPALIKKSKPMARYLGDQLIRVGEYLKKDTDEETPEPPPKVKTEPAASTATAEKPKAAKPKTTAKKPAAKKPAAKRAAPRPQTPPAAEGQA